MRVGKQQGGSVLLRGTLLDSTRVMCTLPAGLSAGTLKLGISLNNGTDGTFSADDLQLYGETGDGKEALVLEQRAALLAGLPAKVASREERLLLLGSARDRGEAQRMMAAMDGSSDGAAAGSSVCC